MKFIRALQAALDGVKDTLKTEMNFKVHMLAALLAILLGFALQIDVSEWLWITLSIALVLAAELFNTALEAITDLVSPSYHILAKKAKDAAAAAVLLTAVFALTCGLVIFLPKLIQIIKN